MLNNYAYATLDSKSIRLVKGVVDSDNGAATGYFNHSQNSTGFVGMQQLQQILDIIPPHLCMCVKVGYTEDCDRLHSAVQRP